MRRYNTINLDKTIKIEEYEDPKVKYGPYIVDDSNFVPISEAIKQLSAQGLTDVELHGYFDFTDGRDTGINIPINRTHDGKDIAEISQNIMEQVKDISDKTLAAEQKINQQNDFQNQLKNINNQLSEPTN